MSEGERRMFWRLALFFAMMFCGTLGVQVVYLMEADIRLSFLIGALFASLIMDAIDIGTLQGKINVLAEEVAKLKKEKQ